MMLAGWLAGGSAAAAGTAGTIGAAAAGSVASIGGPAAMMSAGLSAGTVGGAALSTGSWLSTLSTGLSLASAASSIFGGLQQKNAINEGAIQQSKSLELSAREMEASAREEEVRAKQESNSIMDAMIQTIAEQRVAYATAGTDINFGTPKSVQDSTRNLAKMQLGTSRDDALRRILSRRRQASAYRESGANTIISAGSSGNNAMLSGAVGGAGSVANLIDRRISRG